MSTSSFTVWLYLTYLLLFLNMNISWFRFCLSCFWSILLLNFYVEIK